MQYIVQDALMLGQKLLSGSHESWHQTRTHTHQLQKVKANDFPLYPHLIAGLSDPRSLIDVFLLAVCKRSQGNYFQMAVCGGYIYNSAGGGGRERAQRERGRATKRERKSNRGLPKAFSSTDKSISCLDLGGLSICAWGGVCVVGMWREGQSTGLYVEVCTCKFKEDLNQFSKANSDLVLCHGLHIAEKKPILATY